VDQDGCDSRHDAKGGSPDQATGVLEFLKALPVKGYDHPDHDDGQSEPDLRDEVKVVVVGIESTVGKPGRLVLSIDGCKCTGAGTDQGVIADHFVDTTPSHQAAVHVYLRIPLREGNYTFHHRCGRKNE